MILREFEVALSERDTVGAFGAAGRLEALVRDKINDKVGMAPIIELRVGDYCYRDGLRVLMVRATVDVGDAP